MNKLLNVIGVGPSLTEQGGMGSVSRLIQELTSPSFSLRYIETWDSSHKGVQKLFYFLKGYLTFLRVVLQKEVDLVHIHCSERGSLLRKILIGSVAYQAGIPYILHAHGCEFHVFYSQLPNILKKIIDAFFRRSSMLIVLSESWKEFYISNCKLQPEQVMVLKNPVVFPRYVPLRSAASLNKTRCIKFLFMGKINERKGVYDLVQSISKMDPKDQEKITVILAGSGEVEQLKSFADDLNVLNQLQFLGWVNAEVRDRLLAEADVFILPSYNEGLPMALLEAMSWGLPVITTAVGGIPEVVTPNVNGFLLQPGDIVGLSNAMSSLINNGSLRSNLGSKARNGIASLDIESYSERLFGLYKKAVKKE
ncbi:glycosyltransferase family 4 protein [Leptolyngbya sp. CCNP1308]|uniref:glycosyltransferase family 4 protein n=1 Tax=Leptolyngbya sp. CCNP1308 TaxID=3110255 RepID=UPI002B1FF73D|nr:glycosyltransferase family 4 protein [Leptolyngbya sp. CCNP1308]MEA5449341.1 glycosyltransferase family 4 protein [Leptolyngbya sp. CCNP1308]